MLKLPTGVGEARRGVQQAARGILLGLRQVEGWISCAPAPVTTPSAGRVLAVAGVARGVEEPGAGVVQDRGPAVVAGVGVRLGEVERTVLAELGDDPVVRAGIGARRVDLPGVLAFETSAVSTAAL